VIAHRSDDNACTVKELVYEDGPKLHPINPTHDPIENESEWSVIARLVGVIRKSEGLEMTWRQDEGLKKRHLV
jgi:SOS-response transcriptional repressor LexA